MRKQSIRTTGAVYTPPEVALAIIDYVVASLPAGRLRILEPSVGDGAFLVAGSALATSKHDFTVVDIDGIVTSRIAERADCGAVSVVTGDFLKFAMEESETKRALFDLIIGNPPFIRRHNFSKEFKETLIAFADRFEYPLPDIKNSWAAFLIGACHLVSTDGVVAFVLPYELLTVDYGQKLLAYLQDHFARIEVIVSEDKAFKNIDQDAVILLGWKKSAEGRDGTFIRRVASFSKLEQTESFRVSLGVASTRGLELNAFLLPSGSLEKLRQIGESAPTLGSYADSAPGVVSAANDFFILTEAKAKSLEIFEQTVPILKKGSLAGSSPVFSREHFDKLAEKAACRLLVLHGEKTNFDPATLAYLRVGEERGIPLGYKCRHRRRWYEVPLVKVESGFFFKRSHSIPRLIINGAGTHITDTAYGLRMKDGFSIRGLCFSFYTSLTMLFAELGGRFYGGGVLELSPKEFRRLPIAYHEPTDREWQAFLLAHAEARGATDILDFGDKWLQKHGSFSASDLEMLRKAWKSVRAHRMRHGARREI